MTSETKTNPQYFYKLLQEVLKEEEFSLFSLKEIEQRYAQYYIKVDPTQGDRCVDDRFILENLGEEYSYDKGKYTGRQFPGGTFGIIGVLRVLTGLNEEQVRKLVLQVYEENGWQIGDHIDDDHNQITDVEILDLRNRGCGHEDKIREGALPLYQKIVTSQEVDKRFEWIRKQGGYLPVLTGNHLAEAAGVNLIANETFGNKEAVSNKDHFFNCDLATVAEVAQKLYQPISNESWFSGDKQIFVDKFIKTVTRDYLQTLAALSEIREIQVFQ